MGAVALQLNCEAQRSGLARIETPRLVLRCEARAGEVRLSLLLRPTLRAIGWMAFEQRGEAATLRFWMAPDERGSGLMSEAARHCGPAIETLGARFIRAEVHADNTAALTIGRRLGLKITGSRSGETVRLEKDLCGLL